MTTTIAPQDVPEAFDQAAPAYDRMVALNPGYHRHLRSAAEALLERLPQLPAREGDVPPARGDDAAQVRAGDVSPARADGAAQVRGGDVSPARGGPRPARLVDLGCGSGASTAALVEAAAAAGCEVEVLGVDASSGMLAQAERKRWPAGVRFFARRAQDLGTLRDELGLAGTVDGVLAAYLFRNVGAAVPFGNATAFPAADGAGAGGERDEVLKGVRDLLRPGGVLVVQEYSVAGSALAGAVWSLVCWTVVIPLSWVASGQTRLYRYLWRSVQQFDAVTAFADRLATAGFVDIEVRTVPGWQAGILHTFRAVRAGEEADEAPYGECR